MRIDICISSSSKVQQAAGLGMPRHGREGPPRYHTRLCGSCSLIQGVHACLTGWIGGSWAAPTPPLMQPEVSGHACTRVLMRARCACVIAKRACSLRAVIDTPASPQPFPGSVHALHICSLQSQCVPMGPRHIDLSLDELHQ
jgi:hypothetical protein